MTSGDDAGCHNARNVVEAFPSGHAMGNEDSHSLWSLDRYSAAKKAVLLGRSASMEVERCPHRRNVRDTNDGEIALCGRLAELTGLTDLGLCEARRDACEVCCRSDAPVDSGINPIIASLLHKATSTVIEQGGAHGCDVAKASELLEWAEANLECFFPDDEDECDIDAYRRLPEDCRHSGKRAGERTTTWQGAKYSEAVFECHHPGRNDTTARQCRLCRDWTNDDFVPTPRVSEVIPPPQRRCGSDIGTWAVGVTTSPRKEPTIDICLDNLARAGWEQPRLFVDEGTDLADHQLCLPVTYRQDKAGAWSNFYLALQELLMRQPDADAYLLVQDDAVFYDGENLREYLESSLWPDENIAVVSLYCPEPYTRRHFGWQRSGGKWVWGALALVFPNEAARRFVVDHDVFNHRWSGRRKHAQIDVVVGDWALRHDRDVWYPVPSLVQHIGQTSTIWHEGRASGKRRADRFLGDVLSHGRPTSDAAGQSFPPGSGHNSVSLSKLAVITSWFDTHHSHRWLDNFRRFMEGMRGHGIEVYCVEGILTGERPILPSGDHVMHYELEDILWHKERLLNLGLAALPADVDAVGWFDADLLFHCDHFQETILATLERSPVVQPWQITEWLDADGLFVPWGGKRRWIESMAAVNWNRPPSRKITSPRGAHPGLAWAARRETIDALGGLFDQHPIGGGDAMMAISFWGGWDVQYLEQYNEPMRRACFEWGQRAHRVVQGNVGFVDAAVSHLWHGSQESRRYRSRNSDLCRLGIDPAKHLELAPNDTWKWSASTPHAIIEYVTEYFSGRSEDGEPEA